MLTVRKSGDRTYANHGWLQSRHWFSFADYYDPADMGWGNLRVINEDDVAPGAGFATHGHRDMEIVTYVTAGVLAHKNSMGNGTDIPPGDVHRAALGMPCAPSRQSSPLLAHVASCHRASFDRGRGLRARSCA